MKQQINIMFIVLMMFSFSSTLKLKNHLSKPEEDYMKNIDYLFTGYDIFYGNPLPILGSVDPGFRYTIFKTIYDDKEKTADRRFFVPNGSFLSKSMSCSTDMVHNEITGEEKYKNTLSVEVEASGGFGIEFSASYEFKSVSEDVSKRKTVWIESKADCKLYKGMIAVYAPPPFTLNFYNALNKLKDLTYPKDKEAFWYFIINFGTHYVRQVTMGARFGARSKLSSESLSKLRSTKNAFKTSLGMGSLFKFSTKIESESENTSTVESMLQETKIFSIGSSVPADYKTETWISKAFEEPMPIQYKLQPIFDLVSGEKVLLSNQMHKELNTQNLYKNLKLAVEKYCTDYLLPNKKVKSCTTVDPDIEIREYKKPRMNFDHYFKFKNVGTGKCVTSGEHLRQPFILTDCDNTGYNRLQRFRILPHESHHGRVRICPAFSKGRNGNPYGLTWHIDHADENFYVNVGGWFGHINGSFQIHEDKEFNYTITTPFGKCVNPKHKNTMTGTLLVQNNCDPSNDFQKWVVIPA